jgi:hypothetical protein
MVNLGMGQFQAQSTRLADSEILARSAEQQKLQQERAKNRAELGDVGNIAEERRAIRILEKQREEIKAKYRAAKENKAGWSEIDVLRVEGLKIQSQINEKQKILEDVRAELLKGGGVSENSGIATETQTGKTGAGKSGKVSDTENHRKYLDILRQEKKELEEIKKIGADIDRLEMVGSDMDKDRTLFGGTQRAKAKTNALADRRMPQTVGSIMSQFNANPTDDLRREMAAVDLTEYFKGNLKIDELRKHFAAIPRMIGETVDEYQLRINGFADATVKLKDHFGSRMGLQEMRDYFKEIPQRAKESDEAYRERVAGFVDATIQLNQAMTSTLRQAASDVAVGFGEMLGDLANGTGGLEKFGQRIMGTMSALLKDFGKSMIAFGTAGIVLKNLGKNPYLAVAAGIALVALGQVAQNSMKNKAEGASVKLAKGGLAYGQTAAIIGDNPNVQFDPEVVAPLSKLQKIMGDDRKNGSGGNGYQQIETRIVGTDLYVLHQRVEQRNKALGIG